MSAVLLGQYVLWLADSVTMHQRLSSLRCPLTSFLLRYGRSISGLMAVKFKPTSEVSDWLKGELEIGAATVGSQVDRHINF